MAQTFEAIVAVLDQATGPLRRIQAGLTGITSPISRFNTRLTTLGENVGLSRVGEAADAARGMFALSANPLAAWRRRSK